MSPTTRMAAYGWDSIWELSALDASGPIAVREGRAKPSFGVGVWTGPHSDLLCLKVCETVSESDLWLSPLRESFEDAMTAAIMQYTKLKKLMPRTADRWEQSKGLMLA